MSGRCILTVTACCTLFVFSVIVTVTPASAQVVLFDFDNAPQYTSLPIYQTAGGITALLSATGSGYSIQAANVLGFTPPGFAGHILYPNSINLSDLLVHFDQTITDFSIMYSCQELGCDDAATMRVTAYMNGIFVGTNTKVAANPGTWPVDTLRCTFPQGFNSVVVHYDSHPPTCQDYGTIFMADNMRVTAFVPASISVGPEIVSGTKCFNATGNITVSDFTVTGTGYTEFIAGDNINFLPNTIVELNGYLWAHITTTGSYCPPPLAMVSKPLGTEEINPAFTGESSFFRIYPIPVNGFFTLELSGDVSETAVVTVEIWGMHGDRLLNEQFTGEKKHEFSLSDKPTGIYFIRVTKGDSSGIGKIIHQ